ncbi:hypothetical protein GUITHDRAFT_121724 [Guillardia theta CCMP2712]|uniref:Uncharacterized protein n=1 Tax=Guillardia theta (strain CCMP2712) TaxID=905079 RepID=L1I7N0_GUITC|nr:hypothetical protein GUITHDRAFT_121724 [Guillardia theta CCMP2712]EKX32097.1 hypothetical protein GUITHDRAFT_121724 [Guillardia theta CCMP2712]|eukprot:XP_005819077.1 hypothetical protein GUITHDRAFT_121724 [Guillardia theta CCMP2712]
MTPLMWSAAPMPIALVIIPLVLIGGVVGAIGFASQETDDMSPAEQTKRLNSEARERMERDEELRKKILATDVSGAMYREQLKVKEAN